MSIAEKQKSLVEHFNSLSDWEERYKEIISRGKKLEPIADEYRVDENLVKGCQSRVWLFAKLNEKGEMEIIAESDAMIVSGLVSILVHVFSKEKPTDILNSSVEFLKDLGFEGNLSPSRANGLYSMVKQIRFYATAFQSLLNQQGR